MSTASTNTRSSRSAIRTLGKALIFISLKGLETSRDFIEDLLEDEITAHFFGPVRVLFNSGEALHPLDFRSVRRKRLCRDTEANASSHNRSCANGALFYQPGSRKFSIRCALLPVGSLYMGLCPASTPARGCLQQRGSLPHSPKR